MMTAQVPAGSSAAIPIAPWIGKLGCGVTMECWTMTVMRDVFVFDLSQALASGSVALSGDRT